jgi:hypothetical protein
VTFLGPCSLIQKLMYCPGVKLPRHLGLTTRTVKPYPGGTVASMLHILIIGWLPVTVFVVGVENCRSVPNTIKNPTHDMSLT